MEWKVFGKTKYLIVVPNGNAPFGVFGEASGVASPKGDRPHCGFDVKTASAASAVVDPKPGTGIEYIVPHPVQTVNIFHFCDSASVGFIVCPPVWQWIHIEVLTIYVDAVIAYHANQCICKPTAGRIRQRG